jgi:glycosyltransferase involved in cell wall biosynthesis
MKEICVVAPIYNESTIISEFIKQVSINLRMISNDYEIILVDDGSDDNSWEIISQEAQSDKKIKAIKLSRNFGHHYAITAGIHKANAKWTVVMDADLQDRPEVIQDLYKKAIEGFQVVFVSRTNRPESFLYMLAQKIFYKSLNILSGLKFDSRQANFSIISFTVVEAFKNFPENSRFYVSTIKWLGFKMGEIKADHGTRFSGKPSYTIKKRLKLATDIILSFSDRPLKFAIGLGLVLAIFACTMTGWIFWQASQSDTVVLGWPSIMASIFFVGGAVLTVLGILGIYLDKVFSEVKRRPLYIIEFEID